MVEGAIFIGAIIIAITEFIKNLVKINGAITIAVAVVVGILVAVVDTSIGVADLSIAQGLLIALAAVGVHTTARQVG